MRYALWISAASLVALAGCGGSIGGTDATVIANDRAKSMVDWKLVLEDGGTTSEMPIDRMDIYLTEDGYPEIYEMHGPGVMLVGEFPRDARVDYEEKFENLLGKTIQILPNGGDPGEPKNSSVILSGMGAPVTGGTIQVEKITGKWQGSQGNKTLWGTIEVRIPGANGDRTVRGKFATHAVTWG
jgi:hypothetical protein